MNYIKLLLITFTLSAMPLSADMVISQSIIYFGQDGSNQEDIQIENVGSEPLYIKVTPHIVKNPGTDKQERVAYDDPTEAGLLVSPNRLVIKPGSRKLLRFVNLNSNSTEEKVYRVSVTPVVGQLEDNQTGVKIVIGYEVLVLVPPVNGKEELVYARAGKSLQIENKGTQNILVREGIQCEANVTDENECTVIPGKRLYPGNKWNAELAHNLPVKLYLKKGKENSIKIIE